MDATRRRRPGPAMVAVFALVGLIGGIVAGLLSPSGRPGRQGQALSDQRSQRPATTRLALPSEFYTSVLDSIGPSAGRARAEASARRLRGLGVEDALVLDSERYPSIRQGWWAVASGVFPTDDEALAHCQDLRTTVPKCYVKLARAGATR